MEYYSGLEDYTEVGLHCARALKYKSAILILEGALDRFNNLAPVEVHLALGDCYALAGNIALAEEHFRICAIASEHPQYDCRMAVMDFLQGQTKNAIIRLKTLIKQTEGCLAAWYILGKIYVEKKRFERAALCFEKCVKLRPDFDRPHQQLCAIYNILGQKEKLSHSQKQLALCSPHPRTQ